MLWNIHVMCEEDYRSLQVFKRAKAVVAIGPVCAGETEYCSFSFVFLACLSVLWTPLLPLLSIIIDWRSSPISYWIQFWKKYFFRKVTYLTSNANHKKYQFSLSHVARLLQRYHKIPFYNWFIYFQEENHDKFLIRWSINWYHWLTDFRIIK